MGCGVRGVGCEAYCAQVVVDARTDHVEVFACSGREAAAVPGHVRVPESVKVIYEFSVHEGFGVWRMDECDPHSRKLYLIDR